MRNWKNLQSPAFFFGLFGSILYLLMSRFPIQPSFASQSESVAYVGKWILVAALVFSAASVVLALIKVVVVPYSVEWVNNINSQRKDLLKKISDGKGWNAELFAHHILSSNYSESVEAANKIRDVDYQSRRSDPVNQSVDLIQLRRLMVRIMWIIDAKRKQSESQEDRVTPPPITSPKQHADDTSDLLPQLRINIETTKKIIKAEFINAAIQIILVAAVVCCSIWFFDTVLYRWGYILFHFEPAAYSLVITFSFGLLSSNFIFFVGTNFTEKSPTHFDDLLLYLVFKTAPYFAFLIGGIGAWNQLKSTGLADQFANAFVSLEFAKLNIAVACFTAFLVMMILLFVWRHFAVQMLRLWARRTHQKYDDVFVEILSWIGNLLIITVVYSLFTNLYFTGTEYESLRAALNNYAIGFIILSALIGYAGKQTIENFFSGLVLQVDRPFELGDRLVIPSGEICDVKEIGMRSVTLYDVLANTELSIPNNVLSTMIITNISRPDSQLRIRIPVYVNLNQKYRTADKTREYDILAVCEAALVFIAYLEPEISLALTDWKKYAEIKGESAEKYPSLLLQSLRQPALGRRRSDLLEPLKHLTSQYKFPGENTPVRDAIEQLEKFEQAQGWTKAILSKSSELDPSSKNMAPTLKRFEENVNEWRQLFDNNLDAIWNQISGFGALERSILTLKGQGEEKRIRPVDLEPLLNELQREPTIHSGFSVSAAGQMHTEVTLNCFAEHLERRYEVTHLINRYIDAFFKELNVEFTSSDLKVAE